MLNIKLDKEWGGCRMGKDAPLAPRSHSFLAEASGAEMASPTPIIVKDRQLAVLAAHAATTMRRLANTQRRGQATVTKA